MRAIAHWRRLGRDERGESASEYALIATALAVAALATVFALGGVSGRSVGDAAASVPAASGEASATVDQR